MSSRLLEIARKFNVFYLNGKYNLSLKRENFVFIFDIFSLVKKCREKKITKMNFSYHIQMKTM